MLFNRNDPEDLEEFVKFLFTFCVLVAIIGSTIIMAIAIFNGVLPPEPQWWLSIKEMIIR